MACNFVWSKSLEMICKTKVSGNFFSANERTWTCELGFICHSDQYDATIVRSRSREYFRWDRETIRVKIEEAYGFWRRWRENTELTQSEDDQETAAMNAGDGDCDRIGDMLPTPTDPNTRIKVKISLSLQRFLQYRNHPNRSVILNRTEPNRTGLEILVYKYTFNVPVLFLLQRWEGCSYFVFFVSCIANFFKRNGFLFLCSL